MELSAGYKKTKVGKIPESWDVVKLGSISECFAGLTYSPNDVRAFGTLVLRSSNIQGGRLAFFDNVYVEMEMPNRAIVREGDILICVRNGSRQLIGKTALIDKATAGCAFGAFMSLLRSNSSNFLFFQFQSNFVKRQINDVMGATINQITNKNLEEFKVIWPQNKIERDAIAEALSDADTLIESLENLIEKKRQIKQGAMQELLTGKKRLLGFSGKWQVKSLGQLFMFNGGYTASRDQLSFDGYCYLHYGDIHSSKNTFIDVDASYSEIPKLNIPLNKVSASSLLDDGDVVFVDASEDDEGASRHVVVINPNKIPFISGLHTIVAKRKTNEIHSLFLRYCFQTLEIKSQFKFYAVGTKVSGISKTNIAKIKIKFPIEAEQMEIAKILSDMDLELSQLEQKLSKARQIKQGMMQELLTGRIRLV